MACTLSSCTTADADFQASTGATFEIALTSTSGTGTLQFARYNGTSLLVAPWKFVVAQGVQVLTLVADGLVVGDRMVIREVTKTCTQVLDTFYYSPTASPAGQEIKGL